MRASKVLVVSFYLLAATGVSQLHAAEYGTMHRDAKAVSLLAVLDDPKKFADKRVAVWGVVGGYEEMTMLFFSEEHRRWRDLPNGIRIEPCPELNDLHFKGRAWNELYGLAIRVEGTVKVERMEDEWSILLVAEHVFVPDGDRQTGESKAPK